MRLLVDFKNSISLLDRKGQLTFWLLTLCQLLLGILDLFVIAIFGILGYLGSAYLGVSVLPDALGKILSKFGLEVLEIGEQLKILASIVALMMLAKSVISIFVLRKIFDYLSSQNVLISRNLGQKLLNSSFELVSKRPSQETTYAIGRGVHASEILGNMAIFFSEMVTLVILLVVTISLVPLLGIFITFYFLSIYLVSQKWIGVWAEKNSQSLARLNLEGDRKFQEGLDLYKELFALGKLDWLINGFVSIRKQASNSTANSLLISYIPKYTFETSLIVGSWLIGFLTIFISSAQQSILSLILFFAIGSRVLPSLLRLQVAANTIRSFAGASRVSLNLIQDLNEEEKCKGRHRRCLSSNSITTPVITLQEASFHYQSGNERILDSINLEIRPGTSLGIVGRTGCGKSTLINLVLGILTPTSGEVKLGDMCPRCAIQSFPGVVGYVPQKVGFVDSSIKENIALGQVEDEINDDQVWNSLNQAQLADFVSKLPRGIDTIIGEKGFTLSGGQQQRIGIARALYSNPKILILDEATSALDSATEEAFIETLQALGKDVTKIVVSHKLSTIKFVEQVIYLESGRIAGIGSFSEMSKKFHF